MRRVRTITAIMFSGLLLVSCGGEDSGGNGGNGDASGCKEAVADAAEATSMPERDERLRPAFEACEGLAEFGAAVAEAPEALEGVDVESYVREQCQEVEALRDAALCDAFR